MSSIVVAASFSRVSSHYNPTLANLELEVPGTYRVIEWGPGERVWRREVAHSPYVHGGRLVGAVIDTMSLTLGVRCYASTHALLKTRVADLVKAASQFNYSFYVSFAAELWQYHGCEPADVLIGEAGVLERHRLRQHIQEMRFIIPRRPTLSEGTPI